MANGKTDKREAAGVMTSLPVLVTPGGMGQTISQVQSLFLHLPYIYEMYYKVYAFYGHKYAKRIHIHIHLSSNQEFTFDGIYSSHFQDRSKVQFQSEGVTHFPRKKKVSAFTAGAHPYDSIMI